MWQQDNFIILTKRNMLDVPAIHKYISEYSYWGIGRSIEDMIKAIDNSALCFGVYYELDGSLQQIGFARIISDLVTFGYLADVFILPAFQGQGLGKWLLQVIINHPDLSILRRLTLFTKTPEFYLHSDFLVYDQSDQSKFMVRMQQSKVTE